MDNLYKAYLNARCSLSAIQEIKDAFTDAPARADLFKSTVFGCWWDVQCPHNEGMLMHLMLQFMLDEDRDDGAMVFRVGGHDLRFGPEEFCLITGLRFGHYDRLSQRSDNPFRARVFPDILATDPIRMSDIVHCIPRCGERYTDHDVVRICLVAVLGKGFMGGEGKNIVPDDVLRLVEDLDAWNAFPWGSYVWAATSSWLAVALRSRRESHQESVAERKTPRYNLVGFAWALQIWIFEVFPACRLFATRTCWTIPRCVGWLRTTSVDWSGAKVFLRRVLEEADMEGLGPIELIPTAVEAREDWWVASRRFFDGLEPGLHHQSPVHSATSGVRSSQGRRGLSQSRRSHTPEMPHVHTEHASEGPSHVCDPFLYEQISALYRRLDEMERWRRETQQRCVDLEQWRVEMIQQQQRFEQVYPGSFHSDQPHNLVSPKQELPEFKARRFSLDMISTLPPSIIETILCLLPIQEAARTSILSREWKYKWTKIPKLVFNNDTFKASTDENQLSILEQTFAKPPSERKKMSKRSKIFNAIFQILLMHQGPILEFTLVVDADDTCVEIDQIIFHLSRNNTLKKLKVDLTSAYRLPLSVFSLHQLTDLDLRNCIIDHQQALVGFGNLTRLYMDDVQITKKGLLHLVSNCPLLKSFSLNMDKSYILNYDYSTIFELFECLPLIEHLALWDCIILCIVQDPVPRELPTSLIHLKYICLNDICFIDDYVLPFLVLMIRSSPNLEKIKLRIFPRRITCFEKSEIESVTTMEDYSDILLEHLNELEIEYFSNSKPELEFVKFILIKSPMLKKVRILLFKKVTKDEELQMLRVVLCFPRASPVVKIVVERFDGTQHC